MKERFAFLVLGPGTPHRSVVTESLVLAAGELGLRPFRASPGSGWSLASGRLTVAAPQTCDALFLEAPHWEDPRDFLEAAAAWLPSSGFTLARILTAIPCAYAGRHSALLGGWIDLWLHFTDYLFLTERDESSARWIQALAAKLRTEALPCYVEHWRPDSPRNPALVLLPEARRIAKLFDVEPLIPEQRAGLFAKAEGEDEADSDEELEPPDPWLERLAQGQRARPLPELPKE